MKRIKSKQLLGRIMPQQALPRAARISPMSQSQSSFKSASSLTKVTRNPKGNGIIGHKTMRNLKKRGTNVPKLPKRENTIESGFTFSVLELDEASLVDAASEMLFNMYVEMRGGEKRTRNIANDLREAIREFVLVVKDEYYTSAFHNFNHAVDVSQLMYTLITKYFKKRLIKQQMFYLIVICLCHDISHPGAGTPTLRDYGCLPEDLSLEGFHIERTLELISNSELELFSPKFLRSNELAELIECAKHLIDATDISKHNDYLTAAREAAVVKSGPLPKEHLAILVKVSDLANVVRTFKDSRRWSENLQIEIKAEVKFKQVNPEKFKTEGATDIDDVAAREDRFKRIEKDLSALQEDVKSSVRGAVASQDLAVPTMGFIKSIVIPLSETFLQVCPDAGGDYSMRLRENWKKWHVK